MTEPRRSDVSGTLLDGDAATPLVVVFPDGSRRRLEVTAAEAQSWRSRGREVARGWRGWLARIPGWSIAIGLAKLVVVTVIAGYIGQMIADRSAHQEAKVELDAGLIEEISRESVALFLDAQDAARATTPEERSRLGNKAANAWVLASNGLEGRFRAYYPDSAVIDDWHAYQEALYTWGGLSIDATTSETPAEAAARRGEDVDMLQRYVTDCSREPPVTDPWNAMRQKPPLDEEVYQWVGYCLLGNRGDLARALVTADPDLG